ncbi:MAG: hypothetical protein H0U73_05805 [Tatlockia sp.]|nr:hypothetical protein [Tatlockia sp.]
MKKHEITTDQRKNSSEDNASYLDIDKESVLERQYNQNDFVNNLKRFGDFSLGFSGGAGAALGAIIGTFAFPGLGTLAGAGIGAGFGISIGLAVRGIIGLISNRTTGEKTASPAIQVVLGVGGLGALIGTFIAPGIGTLIGAVSGLLLGVITTYRKPEPIKLATAVDVELTKDQKGSLSTNLYNNQRLQPGSDLDTGKQTSFHEESATLHYIESDSGSYSDDDENDSFPSSGPGSR